MEEKSCILCEPCHVANIKGWGKAQELVKRYGVKLRDAVDAAVALENKIKNSKLR